MDWPNERYVRLYTRDTKTWCLLGWEGQCLLALLFRKADRAGLIDDVHDAADVLVLLRNGMPSEVVESGLSALVKYNVIELSEPGLLIPNFLEAQETPQTDKQRSREYRAKRRDRSRHAPSRAVTPTTEPVTKRDAAVTKRDETVTPRHVPSRAVTLARPYVRQSDPDPSLASPDPSPSPNAPVEMTSAWRPSQDRIDNLLIGGALPSSATEPAIVMFRNIHLGKTDSRRSWEFSWASWATKHYRAHPEHFKPAPVEETTEALATRKAALEERERQWMAREQAKGDAELLAWAEAHKKPGAELEPPSKAALQRRLAGIGGKDG